MRPLLATIDLAALRHNVAAIRAAAPETRLLGVVKANAYGHGLAEIGRALEPLVDGLAVACLEEAEILRAAGRAGRILLLEGFFQRQELPRIAELRLESVVHHPDQAASLAASGLFIPAWIKLNTGMNRLGMDATELARTWDLLANHPAPIRWMTHLACADDQQDPCTDEQCARFEQMTKGLAAEVSIANSAGLLGWPRTRRGWGRPGIALYGVSPFTEGTGKEWGLRPVMRLRSALIRVNHCRAGERVGYGATWRCPRDLPVGVVAVGYGDGYPRHAPSGTPVWINGGCVPLVGRVSMDMITVDLRSAPEARAGDEVELWGPRVPVETIAAHAGTIGYELLTGVTGRVPRVYRE